MNAAADVMAAVLLAFFLAGIAVGVVVVIAVSVRREERAAHRNHPAPRDGLSYFPEAGPDDDDLDQPPWWQARGD
jgi:hypothetical protein